MNRIPRCIMVFLLCLLLLTSCSDLLLQLGEQGDAQIGIEAELSLSLHLQTIPEASGAVPTVQVARGSVVTCTAVVETTKENLDLSYRWYLDGDELLSDSAEARLEANTLELDTSTIALGTSELRAVVYEEAYGLIKQAMITLRIVE
ncbi:MAG: hypothetical protein EOM15_06525 [Spirochaetia bacterium]|nr:hypothetical protein [Spirochaetia bacterium]